MQQRKLQNRVALVTGAGGGIGRAIAERLAQEGCHVAILDVDAEAAQSTAHELQQNGATALALQADVSDAGQVRACVRKTIERLQRVDILVNNAGILRMAPLLEMDAAEWQATFRINVEGTFNCCQAVGPLLVAQGGGRIINMASWLGKSGRAFNSAYSASKFAVIGLTQSLALELAPSRVTVNAICPGIVVNTQMRARAEDDGKKYGIASAEVRQAGIPLGRLQQPEDVARVATFLASDEADYITGEAINVTGGLWMS